MDDSGKVYVKDVDGSPSALPVDKFVQKQLAAMPYMLKPSPGVGAGSRPPNGVPDAGGKLDLSNPAAIAAALGAAGFGKEWTR